MEVFARHGYERATIDEVVREAGFSKGAFYVHFESKEDLFWELLQERIDAQQEVFRAALEPALGLHENQRRILGTVFETRKMDALSPAILLEFTAHGMRNEKVRERLTEMYARWHGFVMEMLTRGQEAGLVRTDIDLKVLASVLMAVFEGMLVQSQLAPEKLRLSKKVDEVSSLILELVAPR